MKKIFLLFLSICLGFTSLIIPVAGAEVAEGEKTKITGFGSELLYAEVEKPIFLLDFNDYKYAINGDYGIKKITG